MVPSKFLKSSPTLTWSMGIFFYFITVSVLLRFPTSIYLDSVPLDPNFPLHALAAQDLADGGTGFINSRLEWPAGAPIRYLAWPLLFIAQPFELFFKAIPAFQLGIVAWLTLQGIGMTYLFHFFVQQWSRALCASTLALCAPQVLIALGNAQFENVAPFFFVLIAWSIVRNHLIALFIGLMGACFSSPYVGFLGLLLALIMGWKNKAVWMLLLSSSIFSLGYYHAVTEGNIHESTQPAPAIMSESANPIGLVLPINVAENGGTTLLSVGQRLSLLQEIPSSSIFDDTWYWVMVTASSYLGVGWLLLGTIGLWSKRRDPIVQQLMIWGGITLLCSFGDRLTLGLEANSLKIPWIWQLSDWIPGLSQMNATHRFLMAPSLLLALGVASLGHRVFLFLGTAVCVLEALLISPAHWPIPAKFVEVPEEIKDIRKPFIFWPSPPIISSYKVTMTSLVLDQPVALFSEEHTTMPTADGQIQRLGTGLNRQGQSIEDWTNQLIDLNINSLIQYRSFQLEGHPFPITTHQRMCYPSYCRSLLIQKIPE